MTDERAEQPMSEPYFSWRHAKRCDVERGLSACTCGLSSWRNALDATESDMSESWLLANETRVTEAYRHGFDEGRASSLAPMTTWRGLCGHVWDRAVEDTDECPRCSERVARGRVEAAAKPDGWHTYHICGGLLRELMFVTHGDERHAMCPVCGVWFRAALSSTEGTSRGEAHIRWADEMPHPIEGTSKSEEPG